MSKEKKAEVTEKVEKGTAPVFTPSLSEFIEKFITEKCTKVKEPNDVRVLLLKYYSGFVTGNNLVKSLRMRAIAPMAISECRKFGYSVQNDCLTACVYDIKFFNTPKETAIKDSLVDLADFEYFSKYVKLDTLDMKDIAEKLPDDLDSSIALLRLPSLKRIGTQATLGIMVEQYLIDNVYATHNNLVRKAIVSVLLGKSSELEMLNQLSELYVASNISMKKIVTYIKNNHSAIVAALADPKAGTANIRLDAEYVSIVQNIK